MSIGEVSSSHLLCQLLLLSLSTLLHQWFLICILHGWVNFLFRVSHIEMRWSEVFLQCIWHFSIANCIFVCTSVLVVLCMRARLELRTIFAHREVTFLNLKTHCFCLLSSNGASRLNTWRWRFPIWNVPSSRVPEPITSKMKVGFLHT